MREPQLWAEPENINAVLEDITAIAENCPVRDCTHSGEPECALAEWHNGHR